VGLIDSRVDDLSNHIGVTNVATRQAAGGILRKKVARFMVERGTGA
jgi:hypothetical protein